MAAPIGAYNFEEEITHIDEVSRNLTLFLSKQENWSSKFIDVSKSLYDLSWRNRKSPGRRKEETKKTQALPNLFTSGFDEEQIWQQIELNNGPLLKELQSKISDFLTDERTFTDQCRMKLDDEFAAAVAAAKQEAASSHAAGETEDKEPADQDDDNSSHLSESDNQNEDDRTLGETSPNDDPGDAATAKTNGVDDRFFKLHEMEIFLEAEDAREERRARGETREDDDDSEEIDFFDENDSEMDGWLDEDQDDDDDDDKVTSSRQAKYSDFFQAQVRDPESGKKKKKVRFSNLEDVSPTDETPAENDDHGDEDIEEEEDDDGPEQTGEKSPFEKRQEKLKEQISQLETENLTERSWQMSGEVRANLRPENSLLEEYMVFDHTSKMDPVITEETTKTLEDLILQRIRDKAWDDVERKVKPTESALEYKKRISLDQEKSKLSLAEVYEQEYLRQTEGEKEDEESKGHKEIRDLMKDLFLKLDALANFHFTPRPAVAEVKIISNLPSITMEEVAPVAVSDAALLAPEEIKKRPRGEVKGASERSKTDKLRSRRQKKKKNKIVTKLSERKQAAADKRNSDTSRGPSKQDALEKLKKQSKSNKSLTVLTSEKKKTNLTSSQSFFAQLQQEVQSDVRKKSAESKQKTQRNVTSRQMKL